MELVGSVFSWSSIRQGLADLGPAIASLTALTIYALNRREARKQMKAKRRVLHAMLAERVAATIQFAATVPGRLAPHGGAPDAMHHHASEGSLSLPDLDRMLELQAELLSIASEGDEVVADFIETCRRYRSGLDALVKLKLPKADEQPPGSSFRVSVLMRIVSASDDARQILKAIQEKGELAKSQLDKFIRRETAREVTALK